MKAKMKAIKFLSIPILAGMASLMACGDDAPEPEVFADPTITISAPANAASGLEADVNTIISFSMTVEAEAGLSRVSVNGSTVKSFDGITTSETLDYEYTVPDQIEIIELVFVVVDADGTETNAATISLTPVIPETSMTIIDFEGSATGSNTFVAPMTWDRRVIQPFSVSGDFTTTASVEVAMQQATPTFGVTAPGEVTAMQIVKQAPDSIDADWGGWAHMLFDLGTALPEVEVAALPASDGNGELTSGTRVITLEVYYDDTVDPAFGWSELISTDAPWNANPTQGYKLDLGLLNYEGVKAFGDGDWSYYVAYSAYISAPNKWETLTFDAKDIERFAKSGSITADQVTGFSLRPAAGYDGSGNKLYVRNMKIVDIN